MIGFLRNIWEGQAILLWPDGYAVKLNSDGTPGPATRPHQVEFFISWDAARAYRDKYPDLCLTAHRVEGLNVLREVYSYS